MHDRLLERAAIDLERFVVGLYSSKPNHEGIAEAAVPWSRRGEIFTRSEIPRLIGEVRRVLLARARFAVDGPAWAQPLPVGDEIAPLLHARGPLYLLGHYSCSLMMMDYDYPGHPLFFDFGCGMMAHPDAPEHVRDDPELLAEFPARVLPGLCGRLIWFGENLQADRLIGP